MTRWKRRRSSLTGREDFLCANAICATAPRGFSALSDPTASKVNEQLAELALRASNHAAGGSAAAILLNTHSNNGQVTSTTAPKSNAALALPAHLAQPPPMTGPTIIAA